MPLALIDLLIKIGVYVFDWLISKSAKDAELLEAFKKFSELARSENIKTIQERKKAEEQLDSANKKWDEKEKKNANP